MAFETYGKPNIERTLAAFRGEKTDRVPLFEILIEDKHITHMLGRQAGNTLGATGDVAKGTSNETASAPPMDPRDYMEVCQIIGQDVILVEALWAPLRRMKDDGKTHIIADRSIKTKEDIKKIIPPSRQDIELKMKYIREYLEAIKGTKIGVALLTGCIFQTNYEFVVGLTDFMMQTYEDREFVEELMEIATNYYVQLVEEACQAGIHFLFAADDVAYKSGLFVPPRLFKELWRGRMEKVFAPALKRGIPVMFHSDGKIDDIVPMLIGMGVSCINPMDPYSVNYREYKKKYGDKVCLSGNIDIEFPLAKGTVQDVERDVIDHLKVMMPGGRYLFGSSHSVVNYIPIENYEAMVNALHKYGRY
ncbi:hypothetical protein KAV79_00265 [Candidatus Aerophobetes bacterium]|nr:hypothetical protein [Candidatus Aerophobetes bacterium]